MQTLLNGLNLILAQTAAEKKLTWLYVGLFAFLMMLLIIDSTASKKYISNNPLKVITWAMFIIAVIVMAVLYFVL